MNKSPDAFRTISEVAEALDVPPHVLRFWETRFAQVKPVKRGGGRRYYRPDDVRLLRGIRGLLYDEGLTIKGVQKILRERGIRHVIGLGTLPDGEDAPAAAPPPKPRPAKSRAPAAGPAARPAPALVAAAGNGRDDDAGASAARGQPDLFGAAVEAAGAAAASGGPLDRGELRRLVGELEALRREMIAGHGG